MKTPTLRYKFLNSGASSSLIVSQRGWSSFTRFFFVDSSRCCHYPSEGEYPIMPFTKFINWTMEDESTCRVCAGIALGDCQEVLSIAKHIVQKLRTSALYVTFAHSLFPISEEQPPRSVHLAINEVRRFGDSEGFAVEEVLSFSYTLR